MGLTIADSYYLKARAATSGYDNSWEEVCEALNYALSYDENHCPSLCLLGEIYVYQLSMQEKAWECFDKIIAINSDYIDVYPIYAKYLIWNNEIERAEKLIEFAHSIHNIDDAQLHWLSSYSAETQCKYKKSLKYLKKAKTAIYNDHFISFIEDEEKRIRKKIKLQQPEESKKKKRSKSSGKKSKKKK